jgi:hypothetical protein
MMCRGLNPDAANAVGMNAHPTNGRTFTDDVRLTALRRVGIDAHGIDGVR